MAAGFRGLANPYSPKSSRPFESRVLLLFCSFSNPCQPYASVIQPARSLPCSTTRKRHRGARQSNKGTQAHTTLSFQPLLCRTPFGVSKSLEFCLQTINLMRPQFAGWHRQDVGATKWKDNASRQQLLCISAIESGPQWTITCFNFPPAARQTAVKSQH